MDSKKKEQLMRYTFLAGGISFIIGFSLTLLKFIYMSQGGLVIWAHESIPPADWLVEKLWWGIHSMVMSILGALLCWDRFKRLIKKDG